MSDFFDIDGNSVAPNMTLGASIYTLLNAPSDAKSCNFYHREYKVVIETIAEYLERIIAEERVPGVIVTMLIPKDGYTAEHSYLIADLDATLANFDIKYYHFKEGIADADFVEVELGAGVTEVFAQDNPDFTALLDLY